MEMSKVGVIIVGDGNQDGVLLCVEGHKVNHNGMGRGTVVQGSELRMIGEVVLVTSRAQPMTNPRYRTPSDPDQVCWTSGLLFEPSAPLTFYLLIPYTSSSDPTSDSACLRTLAPSSCLSFCLTYLIRVYLLVSASLYRTPTPVLTHWTPTGPPIRTRSFSI